MKRAPRFQERAMEAAMKTTTRWAVLAVWAVYAPAVRAAEPGPAPGAALEPFKALSGDWVAASDGPMFKKGDLVARYAVTASGSAVVETVFPGSAHEMVTVYHSDGRDLVLTHFCMEGNQPRMRATAPAAGRVDFAYDGGTNIDPARDRHMHSATFEFLGKDHVRSRWTELAAGKTDFVADMDIVRK
jgi:hypothetical protein